ncbi:lipopolysaccharide biosynthesis protein [Myroides guanonis]|uniref:Membrane protein involved in the export of O-antigen and teichoic acid n=1 Tax=Myroides guanonis TaxID=1150112 RepID=A0A1I3L3T4_9FLAO|nr:oligosaccharide flippase family protein [Myroides guanonis]SFI79349.1 Membrane protein involved in the export of O-antigen and teichoic acid [Myroides guanonis]
MTNSKLLKNTLIYSFGTIGSKAVSFLLVPFLTFYLNKSDLGTYDLLMTLILLLSPIVSFQLSESIYKFIRLEKETIKIREIVSNSIILLFLSILLFEIVFFIINIFVEYEYFYYFSICLVTSILFPFFQKLARALGNNKLFTIIGLLNASIILIVNIILLKFFNFGLISLFLSLIFSNMICILILVFRTNVIGDFNLKSFDKNLINNLLKYSIPLVPNSLSWWLINSSDKFLILAFLSIDDNGIYAISSKYPIILILINSIFILAFQDEKLLEKDNSNLINEGRMFDKYINFQFSLALLFITLSKFMVLFTVASDYIKAYEAMMFLFVGVVFSSLSSYLGVYLMRELSTKEILKSSLIGGVINVLFVLLFIKYLGVLACALGSIVSFFVLFYYRYLYLNRKYFFLVNLKKIIMLTTVIIVIISFIISFDNNIFIIFLITLSAIIFFIVNKHLINIFIKKYV